MTPVQEKRHIQSGRERSINPIYHSGTIVNQEIASPGDEWRLACRTVEKSILAAGIKNTNELPQLSSAPCAELRLLRQRFDSSISDISRRTSFGSARESGLTGLRKDLSARDAVTTVFLIDKRDTAAS
jgi:hypothetical protein